MNSEQRMVKEFHNAFNLPVADSPTTLSQKDAFKRTVLIKEELDELKDALYEYDLLKIADAIADLLYVVYGTAVECGLDIEPIFKEVHRSNMTKKGGYLNDIGKWVKPPTYEEPVLLPIIDSQKGI
ncbi:MAG: Phosphoribosyl-ATP pyrophosphohydrolase [Parcubacteria group bacterium ADurb.Bin216]|nr:MAG: Phosphoribosyl-ATP pyrophosphohydrolase [Parcubacteria group bacterium ADurb.Bin216]